jgi:hypothetical protein
MTITFDILSGYVFQYSLSSVLFFYTLLSPEDRKLFGEGVLQLCGIDAQTLFIVLC